VRMDDPLSQPRERHALIQMARIARRKAAREAEARKTVAEAVEKLAAQRNLTPAGLDLVKSMPLSIDMRMPLPKGRQRK
jgi:uncharacterized membrane protein YqiK